MRTLLALLLVLASAASPLTARAGEKQITDVRELAGTWQGWVTWQNGQDRATMIVKDDGSYQGATTRGTMTVGNFYLQDGTLRYRSSRTTGAAIVSEDKGKIILTIVPEGTHFDTGRTVYERVK